MNKIKLIMMAVLLAAGTGYSQALESVVNIDFESDVVGFPPFDPGVTTSANVPGQNMVVVIASSANTAGTGKGVEYLDNNSSQSSKLEILLPSAQSVLRFDFSFSPVSGLGTVEYINAAVTTVGGAGSSANRFCGMRLMSNKTVFFSGGPSVFGTAIPVLVGTRYAVSIFANDSTNSITYTDPNGVEGRTLAADSAAFWMSGAVDPVVYTSYGSTTLQGAGTGISAGVNNLVNVGFASSTAHINLNYKFDDIKVWKILPPLTPGSLSLYLVGE